MARLINLYECGGAHFAAILETETGERVFACIAEPEGFEPMLDELETEDCDHA